MSSILTGSQIGLYGTKITQSADTHDIVNNPHISTQLEGSTRVDQSTTANKSDRENIIQVKDVVAIVLTQIIVNWDRI